MMCTRSVLIVVLALAAPTAWAQKPFEPKHIAQVKSVTAVAISPDGKYVAYLLSVPRQPLVDQDGPAWSHLYVSDIRGNSRPYIIGHNSIGAPQWSHDSQTIYYTAKRGEDTQTSLYAIPIDGGESVKVLEHPTSISGFALHPNGKQAALLATSEKGEDQEKLEEGGFDQEIFEEDWQPTHVWIANLDVSHGSNDDTAKARRLDLPGSASQVAWKASGDELAVVLAPTPSVDDGYMAKTVSIVDVASGHIVHKVNHAGKLGHVAWSPDGKRIAMIGAADIHDPSDGRLLVVSAIGDDSAEAAVPRDWMPDYEAHVTSFAWKSNDEIVWTADEGTLCRVGVAVADGKASTTIVEPSASHLLSGVTLSDNGQHAGLIGHSREHPPEAFSLSLASGQPNRLTDSNPWLADLAFARQETVSWNAKDGLYLEGVLVYPLHYVEGRRYPLIMLVHGGPESHEADGWVTSYSKPGQIGASRGFFVFYPNYRGSTGRGVDFSKMGQADAAGLEFSDLIDGIDSLIERGLVDRTKVGITGGSYGGYASAWGATYYSERFAASVMFVGISDNVSKVGTTDTPNEMYLVHHRQRLWENWDYFVNSSPIKYVERNRTPTLILHGKQDPRVHPSQSLELHRHLKTLGQAPVRLVLYEGEGHGNRKAAARLDYNLRLMQWMEHYLTGPGGEPPAMQVDYRAALGIVDTAD
jgi:dipeptidyl aminopeptidase/acylaminoacyl peptidase